MFWCFASGGEGLSVIWTSGYLLLEYLPRGVCVLGMDIPGESDQK